MITALMAGAVAGYGIAIPVGAIAILILETGLRRGFRLAAAAGSGAAAADGIYASIAAVFGSALVTVLAPFETPLRIIAVALLVLIGIRGLLSLRHQLAFDAGREAVPVPGAVEGSESDGSASRTFAAFLGVTLLNPITVTYFTALILGLSATGAGPAEQAAFVVGAFLASLSWQLSLAAVSAVFHRRLSPRIRVGVMVLGNAIVLLFALLIATELAA
jgi:threonine/homoserine/homoserine lactone efflux protein